MKENASNSEHNICLILGSNIQPQINISRAIRLLKKSICVKSISSAWETDPVGTIGPNFINVAILATTHLSIKKLKFQLLRQVENRLGRQRFSDKYAPRTMDIDIVIFDGNVVDQNLWQEPYLILTCAEVLPLFEDPRSGKTLQDKANQIKNRDNIKHYSIY